MTPTEVVKPLSPNVLCPDFLQVLEYHPFQVMYSINNTQISHASRSAARASAGQFL